MSLFKVRNWWKTQCPTIEPAYDSFSLHCARLCLEEGEKDSIVVGSHSGQLCIYRPSGGSTNLPDLDAEDTEGQPNQSSSPNDPFENVFQHADVILEVQLAFPVLAISSGKFTTTNKTDPRLQLAVLHPTKLCIYQIVTVDGLADHGDHTLLVTLCDHALSKPAFSLCHGPFGGVKGRDFLCVQHLDGSLKFFEQDGISYERTLATDRHIPSPMHYLQRVDCFVTVAPSWVLECYRYQDIAEALKSLRRHDPIWSLCVGEYALDLQVHQISNTESVIVILGENNLMCVSDTGKVRFIKKLDYSPICFHTFITGWYWEPGARLMLAVVSESGSLLLYESDQIIWSAQLGDVPVAISRANVTGLPGALVTLGATGSLTIGYLGSEPQLFRVPALNLAPFEIARCQKELLELEREIRAGVDPSDASIANAAAEKDVKLSLAIDEELVHCTHPTNIPPGVTTEMCQLSVTVQVELKLEVLQLTVATDEAIGCSKDAFLFRDVVAHSTERLDVWIYPTEQTMPATRTVTVYCSYTNKQGITRVIQKQILLPLKLFLKACQPSKEAQHKLTLSVASTAQNVAGGGLGQLFPEFASDGNSSSSALGLQPVGGGDGRRVTIVAAKNTNRFRIQSDDLGSMTLILECLISRLQGHSSDSDTRKDSSKPVVTISGVPSISGLLRSLQNHCDLRKAVKQLEEELEITTGQMRLFERRFVVKLQERSLRALDGILMLLKRNHSSVAKVCLQLKAIRQRMKLAQIDLAAILHLFHLCYTHTASGSGTKHLEHLTGLLIHSVADSTEQSYEEMLLPVVRFLDQTGPLKNTNEQPDTFDEAFFYTAKQNERSDVDVSIHSELLQKQLQRLLGRVNDRFMNATKTSGSGSGRNSVDFEDQPLPEAHNEEAEEEDEEPGTNNGSGFEFAKLGSTAMVELATTAADDAWVDDAEPDPEADTVVPPSTVAAAACTIPVLVVVICCWAVYLLRGGTHLCGTHACAGLGLLNWTVTGTGCAVGATGRCDGGLAGVGTTTDHRLGHVRGGRYGCANYLLLLLQLLRLLYGNGHQRTTGCRLQAHGTGIGTGRLLALDSVENDLLLLGGSSAARHLDRTDILSRYMHPYIAGCDCLCGRCCRNHLK
uniref:PTHB1 N-terminal domain-containing protein n=1 Tax=Anopheles culicifacies TaxID=139723 RepID=A0A182LY43_9DIPT